MRSIVYCVVPVLDEAPNLEPLFDSFRALGHSLQERHSVHADGRLAAAGATLDDHQPRVGARDQLELPSVEQRRETENASGRLLRVS